MEDSALEVAIVVGGVVLLAVSLGVGLLLFRRMLGKEVATVRVAPGQPFALSLPPTTGSYALWMELETGMDPLPSGMPTLAYRPSATLRITCAGQTVIEGTFERQGLTAYMDHTEESATSHYSRNRKPMLELPPLGDRAGEVHGTFHIDELRGFIGATIILTRRGGG